MGSDAPDHDGAYKKLFSNVHMVRALVERFFSKEVADTLDFDAMTSVDPGFLTPSLTRRTSDLIWKVPTYDGEDVFVVLMLEFQSTVDATMALRVLTYSALLMMHLADKGAIKDGKKLPPVLPFVIYNGAATWTAATSTGELIDVAPTSALWDYQPNLRYYLIDIGRLERVDDVDTIDDPVSMLFELERITTIDEIEVRFARLVALFDLISSSLEEPFAIWFERVMGPRHT